MSIQNVCLSFSDKQPLLVFFDETDAGKAHGQFLRWLNNFMERRNSIAHSLNPGASSGPAQLLKDIDFLEATALSLSETLSLSLPADAPAIEGAGTIESPLNPPAAATIGQKLKALLSFR
jgi:hypothetical protein